LKTVQLIEHPVLQYKLGILRNKQTASSELRRVIHDITILLTYEATRNLELRKMHIETPFGASEVCELTDIPLIVSIMRAGNSMLEGVLTILPQAEVGHIGIYRDRFSHNTVEYYLRLPKSRHQPGKSVFLVDPLVATGDTVLASIDRLKQFHLEKITVICLVASRVSLEKIAYFHPSVLVYTLGIEENLDEQGFLIPGMGDIGSRLYGWTSENHEIG
jgi:uracil phosphoribosyltransferase